MSTDEITPKRQKQMINTGSNFFIVFSFLGSIKDIRTVATHLKEKYKVPLHALGYSMGGFYVTNIINKEPGIFDHIILLNPVVDTISLFSNKQLMDQLWEHAKNILSLKPTKDYKEESSNYKSRFSSNYFEIRKNTLNFFFFY